MTYIEAKNKLEISEGATIVDLTDEGVTVTGFNNSTIGNVTLTVSYEGKTTTFDVTIVTKLVTKINMETVPTKTTYIQNYETLDISGGIIKIIYNDNTTSTISMTNHNVKTSGYDNSKVGTNTITVSYEFVVSETSK